MRVCFKPYVQYTCILYFTLYMQFSMLTTQHQESELKIKINAALITMHSFRPLTFIEDYLRSEVFSCYGNTHTTTSYTSRQTTYFREEAR